MSPASACNALHTIPAQLSQHLCNVAPSRERCSARSVTQHLTVNFPQVFVEASAHAAAEFRDLQPFDPGVTQVDFAITLGGDGTVL
jgi:NAD kinase